MFAGLLFSLIFRGFSCLTLSTYCFLGFSLQTSESQHTKQAAFRLSSSFFCSLNSQSPTANMASAYTTLMKLLLEVTKHLLIKLRDFPIWLYLPGICQSQHLCFLPSHFSQVPLPVWLLRPPYSGFSLMFISVTPKFFLDDLSQWFFKYSFPARSISIWELVKNADLLNQKFRGGAAGST